MFNISSQFVVNPVSTLLFGGSEGPPPFGIIEVRLLCAIGTILLHKITGLRNRCFPSSHRTLRYHSHLSMS